jgi:hypothetical protein
VRLRDAPASLQAIERLAGDPMMTVPAVAPKRRAGSRPNSATGGRRELHPPCRSIPGELLSEDRRCLETNRGSFNEKAEAENSGGLTGLVLIAKNRKPDAIFNYYIDH